MESVCLAYKQCLFDVRYMLFLSMIAFVKLHVYALTAKKKPSFLTLYIN